MLGVTTKKYSMVVEDVLEKAQDSHNRVTLGVMKRY